ncbi:hypothetical protein SNOG_16298 [Parastagonospora nodorum SN15]|uniref:Uncharacterized protein n=2 Tax=Phaeosphaeria nodorum (strain SN15 / ATCC MYA-4574 / FGSC 10173) TaxID=321614 RepID=Q0TVY6_PHANO|nr:hypothetical protein SNOG_16298 [Parastagonospora nodorum SN15]EAT76284.1 hypothetical protein SNOG_16298 [Parastagonospora nodorum SN15]
MLKRQLSRGLDEAEKGFELAAVGCRQALLEVELAHLYCSSIADIKILRRLTPPWPKPHTTAPLHPASDRSEYMRLSYALSWNSLDEIGRKRTIFQPLLYLPHESAPTAISQAEAPTKMTQPSVSARARGAARYLVILTYPSKLEAWSERIDIVHGALTAHMPITFSTQYGVPYEYTDAVTLGGLRYVRRAKDAVRRAFAKSFLDFQDTGME